MVQLISYYSILRSTTDIIQHIRVHRHTHTHTEIIYRNILYCRETKTPFHSLTKKEITKMISNMTKKTRSAVSSTGILVQVSNVFVHAKLPTGHGQLG